MPGKLKNISRALTRLEEHFAESGWKVVYDAPEISGSECCPQKKQITINEKKPLMRLYVLLHEGAHAMIFSLDDYAESFGEIAKQHDRPPKKQTQLYHYQVLKEEMMAWEFGLHLANKLNIHVDFKAYDKLASKNYMTYVFRASQNHYQRAVKHIVKDIGQEITFDNYA